MYFSVNTSYKENHEKVSNCIFDDKLYPISCIV